MRILNDKLAISRVENVVEALPQILPVIRHEDSVTEFLRNILTNFRIALRTMCCNMYNREWFPPIYTA